jgi:hypothetical protein
VCDLSAGSSVTSRLRLYSEWIEVLPLQIRHTLGDVARPGCEGESPLETGFSRSGRDARAERNTRLGPQFFTEMRSPDQRGEWLDAAALCRRVADVTAAPQLIATLLAIAEKFEAEAAKEKV